MTAWPDIPWTPWAETARVLHLRAQIVGKWRLSREPWLNHSWHAVLHVAPRGLTTGPVHDGGRLITATFDFCDMALVVEAEGGTRQSVPLAAGTVAEALEDTARAVEAAGGTWDIHGAPNELPDAVPFARDTRPRPWDADAVRRYHAALIRIDAVMSRFRTGFLGKVSPVHLFWGSFDLAVTRFSGRRAPPHPGGIPNLPDAVTREAYSHEVSSAGFWPGEGAGEPMFYSYAYPAPEGFAEAAVRPDAARWDAGLGEFVLPYEAVRTAPDPDAALTAFLQSTYEAAADLGGWDRAALDCAPGVPGRPRPLAP